MNHFIFKTISQETNCMEYHLQEWAKQTAGYTNIDTNNYYKIKTVMTTNVPISYPCKILDDALMIMRLSVYAFQYGGYNLIRNMETQMWEIHLYSKIYDIKLIEAQIDSDKVKFYLRRFDDTTEKGTTNR